MEKTLKQRDENNRLIAEFMELPMHDGLSLAKTPLKVYEFNYALYSLVELKFHSSWDWLMPVIQKINKWNFKDNPEILVDNSVMTYLKVRRPLYKALHAIDIKETFEAVVSIIKWHNSLSPDNTKD